MSDSRAAFTAGLRALADLIDQRDTIPLPVDGHLVPVQFSFTSAAAMDVAAEALGCDWEPKLSSGSHGVLYGLDGAFGGLRIKLVRYAEETRPELAVA